jgi:ABC-type nitrate/sulfonate/bicarbonate transport system substrate-binding protein
MRGLWMRMSSFLSRRSGDPKNPVKKFTKAHRRALEEYADLKVSLEELRQRLAGVVEFDFQNHERRLDSHYGTPVPGVRIELKDIQAAMDKHAKGEVSTEQLADWATMLQLNQAYDWEGLDEEQIAAWLNEISMLTLKPKGE